jgi:FkbM family methyltransferase
VQSYIHFRWLKNTAARLLVTPEAGNFVGRVLGERIPCRGCIIDTTNPAVSGEVKMMLLLRMYESAEQRFIARHMRTDCDVVELGSSLGVVTSQIARRLRSGRKIVAVEANEDLLGTIRANLDRNAPGVEVRIIHAAIDYTGSSHVHLALGSQSFASRVTEGTGDGAKRVPATTLARLLEREGVEDFVLVSDIEGAEAGVFADAPGTLARCRQIVCELHDTQLDGRSCTADDLVDLACSRHGFHLSDHYGNVAVFEK